MFDIKENLKKLPDSPGVYMHKDSLGEIIYVGKAVSLRNRVRQYFQSYGKSTPKLKSMTSQIAEFEYITCASEMEALILECNLIKKYHPKYNVLLRDDKTYPYIMITTSEKYPRVLKTRELKNDGNKYFGPFSDVGATNDMVALLNKVYHLKRCNATDFPNGFRPCLNYHIGECGGICQGEIAPEKYGESIKDIIDFLSGRDKTLLKTIEKSMKEASERMDFEEAAKYRDLLQSAKNLAQAQRVTMVSGKNMDVILPVKDEENSFVALFQVREGKLVGRETFDLSSELSENKRDLTGEFIKQYYSKWAEVPHIIIVEELPEDKELIERFIGGDKKVNIMVPKKGENLALLKMAKKDVEELVKTLEAKRSVETDKKKALKEELDFVYKNAALQAGLKEDFSGTDYRIESYDISNTNGVDSVGAMVVFQGNRKVRKDYRRFKIRTVEGPDDYASLEEMLTRRFARAEKGDPAFSILPDMIFMDGGIGQVSSARKALNQTGYNIPVIGLAKDDSHRTRAVVFADGSELDLKEHPILFKYAGTIQEEVHRFAIEYHRNLRGKGTITSVLDEIEGIGPKRRNALLSHFGSVEAIKQASKEELTAVKGMTEVAAEKVKSFFSKT